VLLGIRNLTTKFHNNVVHDDISIDFERGEVTAIMGGSGSGKSTLVEFIMFGNKHSIGSLLWEGKDWNRSEIEKKIGFAPQNGGFLSDYTVIENISMPLEYVFGFPKNISLDIAWAAMQTLGLGADICNQHVNTLSGGTLRRASIARALILEQHLLILDEPLSGLDTVNSKILSSLIQDLVPKTTVICVTHHFIQASKYIIINKGKAIEGTYEESMNNPLTRSFLEMH
jgi:phospholipid/cholesterol/gamma-HCH transport system ATP-binding protein